MSKRIDAQGVVYDYDTNERIGTVDPNGGIILDEDPDRDDEDDR